MARGNDALRRRQLDRRFENWRSEAVERPRDGWIRGIRSALGMSLETLASRLGISFQSAQKLEKAELRDAVTIGKLRQAAHALDCDLVYALVPREPLEQHVRNAALAAARKEAAAVANTMALENQGLDEDSLDDLAMRLAVEMIARRDQAIWRG